MLVANLPLWAGCLGRARPSLASGFISENSRRGASCSDSTSSPGGDVSSSPDSLTVCLCGLDDPLLLGGALYYCLLAVITNCVAYNNTNVISHSFRGWKSEIKEPAGQRCPHSLQGRILLSSSSVWGSRCSWTHGSIPLSPSSPGLLFSVSVRKMFVLGFRAHSSSPGLP